MKILILNDYAQVTGGATQVAIESAAGLAEAGHHVLYLAGVGPVCDRLRNTPGLTVRCLEQFDLNADPNRARAALRGLWNPESARATRALVREFQPDLIHLHSFSKSLSPSAILAAIQSRRPVVLTLHDFFIRCPNGGLFNFPNQTVCPLSPMGLACLLSHCDSRSRVDKYWRVTRQFIQDRLVRAARRIDCFLTFSEISQALVQPLLPQGAMLRRVRNPITRAKLDPVPVADNSDFLFVGSLRDFKGPDLLARAAAELRVPAVFVGSGELSAKISELYPQARLAGWQDNAGVLAQMRSARALVFPSRWYEMQPLVVPEALALGLPVIVSSVCTAREWITQGVTGFTFENNNLADLKAKMTLLLDPERARAMGAKAYQSYWSTPPTLEAHVQALERIYQELLSQRPA